MSKKTRQQRRAQERRPPRKRRRGLAIFSIFVILLLVVGGFLVALAVTNRPEITRGAIPGEHWHASYRIYICGQRLTNYPQVEGDVHSHADGFMHIHPATQASAGENASLGTFLRTYETFLGAEPDGTRTLIFPDGTRFSDGDTCPEDDEPQEIEVLLNGEPVEGDPAALIPHDGDAVVIRFGPEGEEPLPNPYAQVAGIPDPGFGGPAPAPD